MIEWSQEEEQEANCSSSSSFFCVIKTKLLIPSLPPVSFRVILWIGSYSREEDLDDFDQITIILSSGYKEELEAADETIVFGLIWIREVIE